mgnify:CR=1 FL=1
MTKVTIAFCLDRVNTSKDGRDPWKQVVHIWEESGDTDSVRIHKVMNRQIIDAIEKWTAKYNDTGSISREPPKENIHDALCVRLFDITMEAMPSNSKNVPRIRLDYQRHGCSQEEAANFMEVVAEFRRELRPILVR